MHCLHWTNTAQNSPTQSATESLLDICPVMWYLRAVLEVAFHQAMLLPESRLRSRRKL